MRRIGRRWLALGLAVLALVLSWPALKPAATESAPPMQAQTEYPETPELRRRAELADHFAWLEPATDSHPWLRPGLSRSAVIAEKHNLTAAGDLLGAARAAGLLAAEAQIRADRVLDRWDNQIDPETGLLPKGLKDRKLLWEYADTGADLYPHLVIAARLLRPASSPALEQVIGAERVMAGSIRLPSDVNLASDRSEEDTLKDRMYGAVEYAKDGLLPMTERLGPGPWLARLEELAQAAADESPFTTPFGPIPSDESEVNGQALQIFSRLYWATGQERYYAAAERIARTYLEVILPDTGHIPPRSYDLAAGRPRTDRAQLRDHGNEVVAGLVEFHLIEATRGAPTMAEHRLGVRAMLDRLLEVGLTPAGHWKSAIDLDDGRALQDTFSDNWGYLYAAYLTQALIEDIWPIDEPSPAERYRAAAQAGLTAAAQLELYPWQGTEPDGYADTIESALYVLDRLDDPAAAAWVDRQAGTLLGAQDASGRVQDGYLDGNFIRSALLYAAWQTQGARIEPWEPHALLGATRDDDCLQLVLASTHDWQGRLVFDGPRHRLHIRLPINYPRLNAWPEWFAPEPDWRYRLEETGGTSQEFAGAELHRGLDLRLEPGIERQLRICPSG